MIDVSTFQRIKPVVLSFIILAAVLFPISVDPSHKSVIDALAPFEVVADGFREPMGVVVDERGVIFVSDRKRGKVFEIMNGKVETPPQAAVIGDRDQTLQSYHSWRRCIWFNRVGKEAGCRL